MRAILIALQKQLRGQERHGHAVSAVSQSEQMLRVTPMGSNVRQTVGRFGKKTFPRVFGLFGAEAGIYGCLITSKADAARRQSRSRSSSRSVAAVFSTDDQPIV